MKRHSGHHRHQLDQFFNPIHHFNSLLVEMAVAAALFMIAAGAVIVVLRMSSVEWLGYRGPRLRWSWGLIAGAPLAAILGAITGSVTGLDPRIGAGAGSFGAMLGSIGVARRDYEDRRSPKEQLRWRRQELLGPMDLLKKSVRVRAAATRKGIIRGDLILGEDARGQLVGPSGRELVGGGMLVGLPGTGKTTTARRLMRTAVANGWGAVYVDAKSGPDQAAFLERLAREHGRPFLRFDVRGGSEHYNPLAGLSAVEAREFLMRVFRPDFDSRSAVYRTAMSNRLLLTAQVLETRGETLEIERIRDLWTDGALSHAARGTALADQVASRIAAAKSDGANRDGVATGLARLEEFVAPVAGRLGGEGAFSLAHALTRDPRPICLVSFDTQSFPEVARGLAGLVVQDLSVAGGRFIGAGRMARIVVVMDEAARYVPENVADFMLQTAREAAIATVLATQTPADLDAVAQAFRDRSSAGVSWLLGFRLDAQGADWFGREAGMVPRVEATEQHEAMQGPTGLKTEAAGYEMKIHPSRIQALPDAQAALVRRARDDARIIRTWRDDR